MSDRTRRSRNPDGDPELLAALRNLGTDYEPDVAAIERRSRSRPAPKAKRIPTAIRNSPPVLLPAAAVLLLIGGVVGVTSVGIRHSQSDPTAANPNWTAATTAAPTPPRPEPSKKLVTPPRRSAAAPTKPAKSPVATKPARQTTATVQVAVQPITQIGTEVTLSRPPLTDWLAVGARADLKQVRAKANATEPMVTVEQPETATSVISPFSASWTGGFPEEDHDAATRWLRADPNPGLTVVLTRSNKARTLTLFAGTQGLQSTVAISGKGLTPSQTPLGAASPMPQAMVITLSLPPTKGPTRVHLSGATAGSMSSLYLAAAALSEKP
jgi:hypothetical protein